MSELFGGNCGLFFLASDLPPTICPGLDAAMAANGRAPLWDWRMALSYPFEETQQEAESEG